MPQTPLPGQSQLACGISSSSCVALVTYVAYTFGAIPGYVVSFGRGHLGLMLSPYVGPVCGPRIAGVKMYTATNSVIRRGNGLNVGGVG